MNIYVAIVCLLASVNADGTLGLGSLEGLSGLGAPGGLVYAPGHASLDYYAYPRYAFEYAVKDPHTGDNKAQWEKREGDVVKGAYSLVEPDGSLRVVEYWADDKSGFNAVVKRLGPNVHPTTVQAAPIYKAPIPVLSHGPVVSPISIGPVAQLGHLANAPLISGPAYGAVSTQSLVKEPLPIFKTVIPSAPIPEPLPILPAPVIKPAILSEPIYRAGPIYTKPLGPPLSYKAPLPIYKAPLPIYKAPLPIYKAPLPIYKAPLPIYKAPLPVYKEGPLPINPGPINWEVIDKEPNAPYGNLEKGPVDLLEIGGPGLIKGAMGPWEGLVKESIGPLRPLDLDGYGLVKGPIGPLSLGPGYDVIGRGPVLPAWGGPLDYPLEYKQ